MVGFWTPVFSFLDLVFTTWGKWLRESAPFGLGEHLRLVDQPYKATLSRGDDLEAKFAEWPTGREILLELDKGLMIRRSFHAPKEAIREVGKVVALEAARVLPLQIDSLVFSYEVKDHISAGHQRVDIVAARKSLINDIFRIAQYNGVQLADIIVPSEDGTAATRFSLMPIKRRKFLRVTAILSVVLMIFSVLVMVPKVYQFRLENEIFALDNAIREARSNTETLASLQRQVREMQGLSEAVNLERNNSQLVELLVTLTSVSPDDIVLEEFRIDRRRVFVSGTAAAPEDWVINLEKLPVFENVILQSVRDRGDALARKFEVRFDVVWQTNFEASQ